MANLVGPLRMSGCRLEHGLFEVRVNLGRDGLGERDREMRRVEPDDLPVDDRVADRQVRTNNLVEFGGEDARALRVEFPVEELEWCWGGVRDEATLLQHFGLREAAEGVDGRGRGVLD